MRTVYAAQFMIADEHLSPLQVMERAGRLACDWVAEWYQRQGIPIDGPPIWQLGCEPAPGHAIELAVRQAGSDCQLSVLDWSYPSIDDPRAQWRSCVTIARCADHVEASVVIRLGSTDFVVAPFRYRLRRPNLVPRLVRSLRATVGGRPVNLHALRLGPHDVRSFVEHDLLCPTRLLPIVVVSQEPATGLPLCDPDELANRLAGIAEVFLLNGIETTFELTEATGKEFSCFNGAIRTYWPGLSLEHDSPFSHPLGLPSRLRQHRDVVQGLFEQFAEMSALRYVPGAVIREATDRVADEEVEQEADFHKRYERAVAAARESQRKAEVAAAAAEQHPALAAALEETRRELKAAAGLADLALDENSSLRRDLQTLRNENRELRERNADLEAKVSSLTLVHEYTAQQRGASVAELESETELDPPASVIAALERVEQEFRDAVVIHERARRSARESTYRRPQAVYDALSFIVSTYARKFSAPLGQPLQQVFADAGYEVHWNIGTVTRGQYRQHYVVDYEGEQVWIQTHLTFKGKANENCLSIHWYADEVRKRLLIGHCGDHLPYATG